jgi:hypothetical protein
MTGSAKQSSLAAAKKGQIASAFALRRFGGLPPGVACAASEEGSSQALLARAVAITALFSVGFSVLVQKDMDKDLFFGDEGPKAFRRAPPYLYFR